MFGTPLHDVTVCGERPDLVVCGRGGAELFGLIAPHDLSTALTADVVQRLLTASDCQVQTLHNVSAIRRR